MKKFTTMEGLPDLSLLVDYVCHDQKLFIIYIYTMHELLMEKIIICNVHDKNKNIYSVTTKHRASPTDNAISFSSENNLRHQNIVHAYLPISDELNEACKTVHENILTDIKNMKRFRSDINNDIIRTVSLIV